MRAQKGNKVYTINESQVKGYQDAGFDIVDDAGKIIKYGRGRTVPYEEYATLKEKNAALEGKMKELEDLVQRLENGEDDISKSKRTQGKKVE